VYFCRPFRQKWAKKQIENDDVTQEGIPLKSRKSGAKPDISAMCITMEGLPTSLKVGLKWNLV
jgi:hypothetical protein